jgi:hypothetical protein
MRGGLPLGIVDIEHSGVGTEVTLTWGEQSGGSSKPTVERYRQAEIRATVGPLPYSQDASWNGWQHASEAMKK